MARLRMDPGLDRAAIRSWLNERMIQVSSARAHNDLAALRLFFAWAKEERWREDDPTENIRVKRTKTLPTAPLENNDLGCMLRKSVV